MTVLSHDCIEPTCTVLPAALMLLRPPLISCDVPCAGMRFVRLRSAGCAGTTKARMTARLTFLERRSIQQEGKPGEMERLRGELQEARAHADWYQQQMAFFEQQRADVGRAMVGHKRTGNIGGSSSTGLRAPVAQFPVGSSIPVL